MIYPIIITYYDWVYVYGLHHAIRLFPGASIALYCTLERGLNKPERGADWPKSFILQ